MSQTWIVCVNDKRRVKEVKTELETLGIIDKTRKIENDGTVFRVPVLKNPGFDEARVPWVHVVCETAAGGTRVRGDLRSRMPTLLAGIDEVSEELVEKLLDQCPTRYQLYDPLILFSAGSFTKSEAWTEFLALPGSVTFFERLVKAYSTASCVYTHVAENAPIVEESVMRRPSKIKFIYPSSTVDDNDDHDVEVDGDENDDTFSTLWVHTSQNGIHQIWSPAHTMFSRGNIKEKARILRLALETTKKYKPAPNSPWTRPVAVDMYAGIGYFSFSYLKAGFGPVFCWELNPWSVQGFLKGAAMNNWSTTLVKDDKYLFDPKGQAQTLFIAQKDNSVAFDALMSSWSLPDNKLLESPSPPISHINMGLLPSTNLSWPTVSKLVRFSSSSSVLLHVHANLSLDEMEDWSKATVEEFQSLMDGLKKANQFSDGYSSNNSLSYSVTFSHLEKIKTYAPGVWHICADIGIEKSL